MIDISKINHISQDIQLELDAISLAHDKIKRSLLKYSDGKNLKGDELTGWLGEIFAKILLDGTLVDDTNEHDFLVTETGERYAVKARKGKSKGWKETSAINKIEGEDCPHYLLFIHFNDSYEIENIWRFDWHEMVAKERFKRKKVRGEENRWLFRVAPTKDKCYLIYSKKKQQLTTYKRQSSADGLRRRLY